MTLSKFISLSLAASLLPGIISGAEKPHNLFPDAQTRETLAGIYGAVYEKNPSLLSWWDYETWSTIGTEASAGGGKLHSPMAPDRIKGISVKTESILHQKNTGWTFSGKFEYGIDIADSVSSTLSYKKRLYGSPSMFFCIAPGAKWELQHYSLAATASKRLGDTWSAGVHLEYLGGKQFRKSDVRNEQTSLDISLEAGVTGIFGKNLLSAGLSYGRSKEKPQFSRAYNNGADYFIYLMNGLGTQITGVESAQSWRQNVPGAYLSWGLHGERNRLTAGYSFKYGEDCWKSEGIQSASRQEKITRYEFTAHEVSLTDILDLECGGKLIFNGSLDFVSGKSSNWNKTASVFIEDYSSTVYGGHARILFSNSDRIFRKAGIHADASGESRHDKNYDARLDGLNVSGNVFAGFGAKAGKADISMEVNGGVSKWLTADYQPNAAKDGYNIYTTYVGMAEKAYMDAGQWNTGIRLNVEFPAGKTLISLGGSYSYHGAAADNQYKGTRWQYGKFCLNICF